MQCICLNFSRITSLFNFKSQQTLYFHLTSVIIVISHHLTCNWEIDVVLCLAIIILCAFDNN